MDISYKDLIAPAFYGLWNDIVQYKYPEIWLAGGRGCVDGNTPIDTPLGSIPIKDFPGGRIFAIDHKGAITTAFACKPIRYTKEPLYRVALDDVSILATDEHRFLTPNGWKPLKHLTSRDLIACADVEAHQKLHLSTPALESQNVSSYAPLTKACTPRLSSVALSFEKESFSRGQIHCEGCLEEKLEDVPHWMRTLLGLIYRYWHDFRLCDGLPPREGETYLDVFLQLGDALGHNHAEHRGGFYREQIYNPKAICGDLRSMQGCLPRQEGKCYGVSGNGILQRLFELLLETAPLMEQSQKTEDRACKIQQVVTLVLSSILHLDSSEDGLCGLDASALPKDLLEESSLQMLYDMLRHTVHDESYSSTFQVKEDVANNNHHYTIFKHIKSIAFEKNDYYYDLFVPQYNNYIANGIVNHNSTKSSFAATATVLLMESNPMIHCVCFRKYASNLADSIYTQFEYTINEKLRPIAGNWIFKKSPLKIIRERPDGKNQQILFRGLDDPQKVKSLKMPFGWPGITIFEELAEFDGIEEIRNVSQSLHRGGHRFLTLCAYNPPESSASWVNAEAAVPQIVDGKLYRYVHHSDYRSVPRDWLGENFFVEADLLRRTNERAYRHEYLGETTGNGGAIFPNVSPMEMTDEMISHFDNRRFAIDFGFSLDPLAFTASHFDKNHRSIYVFDEIYQTNLTNMVLAEMLKAKSEEIGFEYIMCDSAEPKSIAELESLGINVLPAQKSPDSRHYSYRWLQSLAHIYVDPQRCPNVYKELIQCEYEKNKAGLFISRYPQINDHGIDSLRYAYMSDAMDSGLF